MYSLETHLLYYISYNFIYEYDRDIFMQRLAIYNASLSLFSVFQLNILLIISFYIYIK